MLVAAHPQLLAVVHGDDVVAVEPRVDGLDALDVDDGRAVHAGEATRVQAGLQGAPPSQWRCRSCTRSCGGPARERPP